MEQNIVDGKNLHFHADSTAYNGDCGFVAVAEQQQQQQLRRQHQEDSTMRGSSPGYESPDAGLPSGTTSETSVSFESAAASSSSSNANNGNGADKPTASNRRYCKAGRKTHTGGNAKISKKKQKKISSTLLFPTTSSMPAYYQYLLLHSIQIDEDVEIILPKDPRRWSKEDINLWLMEISLEQNINPPIDSSSFPINGKALCSLKVEMFVSRVPDFGKLLYKDVQLRLAKALITEKVVEAK